MTPIHVPTNTAGPPIPVGNNPAAIVVTPNGKTAYVSNQGDNTVTPIRTATNSALTPIPAGHQPFDMAVTPNGRHVSVVNSAPQFSARLPIGPRAQCVINSSVANLTRTRAHGDGAVVVLHQGPGLSLRSLALNGDEPILQHQYAVPAA